MFLLCVKMVPNISNVWYFLVHNALVLFQSDPYNSKVDDKN